MPLSSFRPGILGSLCLLGLGASSAHAATFTVTTLADSGPGSLRQAVLLAEANKDSDTIVFPSALKGVIQLTSGEIAVSRPVIIHGSGADKISVSGNNAGRIFNVASGAITIDNLKLVEGRIAPASGEAQGGAIFNHGKLTLTQVIFSGNSALGARGTVGQKGNNARGGAIFNTGTLSLNAVQFLNNSATGGNGGSGRPGDGGGGRGGGRPVPGGKGGNAYGGAVYNGGSLLKKTGLTFSGNTVVGGEPGLYSTTGTGLALGPDIRDVPPKAANVTASGVVNYPFGFTLIGKGDELTYTLVSGTLPAGLTLSAAGIISGTPTSTVKNAVVTYRVSDGFRTSKPATLTINIEAAPPTNLVVTTAQDTINASDGVTSLHEALKLAELNPDANLITFDLPAGSATTLSLNPYFQYPNMLTLNTPVTIQGPTTGITLQSLSASRMVRLFTIGAKGNVTLSNLTMTNGATIENLGGSLNVVDCTLSENSMQDNGGAILNRGTLQVKRCTFAKNSANRNSDNVKGDGGAIANYGRATISGSTFSENTATLNNNLGGAIYNEGDLTLTSSTFSQNQASFYGGGLYNQKKATVSNCTFIGNGGYAGAGGIANIGGQLTLDSSTLVGNGGSKGAGLLASIYYYGPFADNSTTTIRNSIIAGNLLGEDGTLDMESESNDYYKATVISGSSNLIGDTNTKASFNKSGDRTGLDGNDLKLDVLADNGGPVQTIALLSGSPAINTGNTDLAFDARGYSRPGGGKDDIGAFEKDGGEAQPDGQKPVVLIVGPSKNQSLAISAFGTNAVKGKATDNTVVAAVNLQLVRQRGGVTEYWNGSAFTTTAANVPATLSTLNNPETVWKWLKKLPTAKVLDAGAYTLNVSATDDAGNEGQATTTFTLTGATSANAF